MVETQVFPLGECELGSRSAEKHSAGLVLVPAQNSNVKVAGSAESDILGPNLRSESQIS